MTDAPRCPHCGLNADWCKDSCAGPKPFVDLTTLGANVKPADLFSDPRYIPPPDMPAGEPDHHELVRAFAEVVNTLLVTAQNVERLRVMVTMLETRIEALEDGNPDDKRRACTGPCCS